MMIAFKDIFETKLGTIESRLQTDSDVAIQQRDKFRFTTKGYNVYCQVFDLLHCRIPDGMAFETSKGWRWFIEKTNDEKEQLTIYCELVNPSSELKSGANSGEHLDAIEIENSQHHLHIGTEDGEAMQYRAEISDWMPKRFKDEVDVYKSFTEYIDYGFRTTIPILERGEKIYFHYLVATDAIRPDNQYPDQNDISTWFAVDQLKKELDEMLAANQNV